MLKIAMLSKWHVHARGYARQIRERSDAVITAVWDEDPARGAEWAAELGASFEPDLDKLLARPDVDAVVCDAPTNMHADVLIKAARAGKHIFTEKVLAPTVAECTQIAAEIEKAGVKFCIPLFMKASPANLFVKKSIDDGLLGTITHARVRNAHNGATGNWLPEYFYDPAQACGGAMMDLGAHPMYLLNWLLGKPVKVTSVFTSLTGKRVEDNAVSLIEFENAAIAVSETGFVTPASPFCLEVYGTDGSVVVGGPDNAVRLFSSKTGGTVGGWITPSQLPKALPAPMDQWIRGINEGTPILFGLDDAIGLTELMEAAYIAHREGRTVGIGELKR